MGYFPILYTRPSPVEYENGKEDPQYKKDKRVWTPTEIIYQYIESEIPVILAFDNHVVIVVGHKIYDRTKDIKSRLEGAVDGMRREEAIIRKRQRDYRHPSVTSTSLLVDAFIIQDDQGGVYRLLPTDKDSFELLQTDYGDLLPIEKQDEHGERYRSYETIEKSVGGIIIPLPDKIYLLAEDVYGLTKKLFSSEAKNRSLIPRIIEQGASGNRYAKNLLASLVVDREDPVVLRIYCTKSSDFKSRVNAITGIDSMVRQTYLDISMPRFIWVAEISTFSVYAEHHRIVGEILFDSTANKFDINGCVLSTHLPGFFSFREGGEPGVSIDTEEPYSIHIRKTSKEPNTILGGGR